MSMEGWMIGTEGVSDDSDGEINRLDLQIGGSIESFDDFAWADDGLQEKTDYFYVKNNLDGMKYGVDGGSDTAGWAVTKELMTVTNSEVALMS